MMKNKGLGRGLDALFGEESAPEREPVGIRISDIEPNPDQPRRTFGEQALSDLAESIRQNGVITPLTLRKTGGTYQIIAGERRWRASRLAGLTHVPAIVLDVSEQEAYQLALIENLQREDLNPMEEAEGYQTLMEQGGLTQEQAAEKVGKSRPAVANALRLLSLPKALRTLVSDGELSAGHARAILGLRSQEQMLSLAQRVIDEGLSVRQTEELVRRSGQKSKKEDKKPQEKDIYTRQLERDMAAFTGHKVSIEAGRKKGRLTIEYYGNEDLEKICQALKRMQ